MSLRYSDKPWVKQYDKGVPATIEVPTHPVQHFLEEGARRIPVSYTHLDVYKRQITCMLCNQLMSQIGFSHRSWGQAIVENIRNNISTVRPGDRAMFNCYLVE